MRTVIAFMCGLAWATVPAVSPGNQAAIIAALVLGFLWLFIDWKLPIPLAANARARERGPQAEYIDRTLERPNVIAWTPPRLPSQSELRPDYK